jgi:hypothetical protein
MLPPCWLPVLFDDPRSFVGVRTCVSVRSEYALAADARHHRLAEQLVGAVLRVCRLW